MSNIIKAMLVAGAMAGAAFVGAAPAAAHDYRGYYGSGVSVRLEGGRGYYRDDYRRGYYRDRYRDHRRYHRHRRAYYRDRYDHDRRHSWRDRDYDRRYDRRWDY